MALEAVKDLVQKLMADVGLREKLRQDPEVVFQGHALTAEEKTAILSVGARHGFVTPSGTTWEANSLIWWGS